jgi:hypothetical protein
MEGTLLEIQVERPSSAALEAAARPLREDTDEPRRRARLLLRTLLSQPDIDHVVTNAVADQFADHVIRAVTSSIRTLALEEYGQGLLAASGARNTEESRATAAVGDAMIARAAALKAGQ